MPAVVHLLLESYCIALQNKRKHFSNTFSIFCSSLVFSFLRSMDILGSWRLFLNMGKDFLFKAISTLLLLGEWVSLMVFYLLLFQPYMVLRINYLYSISNTFLEHLFFLSEWFLTFLLIKVGLSLFVWILSSIKW